MAQTTVRFGTPALVRSGDEVLVNFSDGTQLELTGPAGLQDYVGQNLPADFNLRALLIANRLAADPLLDSPELWDGKSLTMDPEAAAPAAIITVE